MPKKWNPDAKPAEKMLSLYSLLLFSRYELSLSELANTLNCSKQTICRLIDQLEASAYGKVMRVQRGREALYYLDRPKLPQLRLDAESLEMLALCHDFVRHLLPAGLQKNVDGTLRLAKAYAQTDPGSEGDKGPCFPLTTKTVYKGRIDYSSKQDILQTIMRAIKARKVCSLEYKAGPAEESRRFEFAPMCIISFHESIRVQGWIVTDQGLVRPLYERPATLPLQRIQGFELGTRSAAKLPDVPQSAEMFGLMNDEVFTARILFHPEAAAYVAEREWSAKQRLTWNDNGSLLLELESQSWAELLSWVLSFGDSAEVISPDWLRLELAEKVRNLVGVYGLASDVESPFEGEKSEQ